MGYHPKKRRFFNRMALKDAEGERWPMAKRGALVDLHQATSEWRFKVAMPKPVELKHVMDIFRTFFLLEQQSEAFFLWGGGLQASSRKNCWWIPRWFTLSAKSFAAWTPTYKCVARPWCLMKIGPCNQWWVQGSQLTNYLCKLQQA